jgi:triacylglycerol lipase
MDERDIRRLRGLKALVHDAVDGTTDLVEVGHESAARSITRMSERVPALQQPGRVVDTLRRASTRGVLLTVKTINRAVEALTDLALDVAHPALVDGTAEPSRAIPMRSDAPGSAAWAADAALGLANGTFGDGLADQDGLDLGMEVRVGDRYLPLDADAWRAALPDASPRVALFVHGLATTEWSWCLASEAYHGDPATCFGTLLQRDLGFTPLYLRYNTGRRIPENGERLARILDRLLEVYPTPIEDLTLLGHSMGGLVLRSACHHGSGAPWTDRVSRVFTFGSPHEGAPLARFGDALAGVLEAVDTPATQVLARVLDGLSAGIKDLRHGTVTADELLEEVALPRVRYHFLSATVTMDADHPFGQLVGDLLVRTPSAEGPATLREAHFHIETAHHGGVMHHQLQNHPAVYEQVRRACDPGSEPR